MDYVELEEAKERGGLRLVLTPGLPGPWGEAAKSLFHVKKLDYLPVRQPGEDEAEGRRLLFEWTHQTSAPAAMYEDERPRTGWAEILLLAERLAPEPALVPADPGQRALLFGLCREICGEQGLGWSRRLSLLPPQELVAGRMAWKYGVADGVDRQRADARVREIFALLLSQLEAQRAAGSDYLLGDSLSALDIYWAHFSGIFLPLSPDRCPAPEPIRQVYTAPEELRPDPRLIAQRDLVFERHLKLPQDF